MISLIIVNYHSKTLIQQCLASVEKYCNNVEKEIMIVDNAQELIPSDFPSCQLIIAEHNLGFGAGVNLGIKASKGDAILLVNPDIVLQDDTITTMLRVLQQDKTVGVVGARLQYPDGRIQACQGKFPSWLSIFFTRTRLYKLFPYGMYFSPRYTTLTAVDWVSGGFMLLRKTMLDAIGVFDEQFFMFYEDMDLCYRAHQAGWKVLFEPEARVIHDQGATYKKNKGVAHDYSAASYRYFIRKHGLSLL